MVTASPDQLVSLSPFPLCLPPWPVIRFPEAIGTEHVGPQRTFRRKNVEAGLQLQEGVLVSRSFARGLSFGLSWSARPVLQWNDFSRSRGVGGRVSGTLFLAISLDGLLLSTHTSRRPPDTV